MGNEELLYRLVKSGEWEIDPLGRVWSNKGGKRKRIEHRTPQGYLQVRKMSMGIRIHTGAHRLVWMHCNGEIPNGQTINHKNGIKDDNRPENLEIASYVEQAKHTIYKLKKNQRVLNQWGMNNYASKLSTKEVIEIRERRATGETLNSIAMDYPVTFQTISRIARGNRRSRG